MVGRLRLWAAVAVLAALAVLGTTPHAHADFSITASEGTGGAQGTATLNDNGSVTGTANGGGGSVLTSSNAAGNSFINGSVNTTDFSILVAAGSSNAPGSPTTGKMTLTALNITNMGSSAATLTITLSGTGFTNPSGTYPISLQTQVTDVGSALLSGDSVNSTSAGTPVGSGGASGTTSEAALSNITAAAANGNGFFTVGSGGYNLSQTITLTLNAGETISLTGFTQATAPAPGGLTLACAGLLCVAPLIWLRRRKMALLAA